MKTHTYQYQLHHLQHLKLPNTLNQHRAHVKQSNTAIPKKNNVLIPLCFVLITKDFAFRNKFTRHSQFQLIDHHRLCPSAAPFRESIYEYPAQCDVISLGGKNVNLIWNNNVPLTRTFAEYPMNLNRAVVVVVAH